MNINAKTDIEKALTHYDDNSDMPYCDLVRMALKRLKPTKPICKDLRWLGKGPEQCPNCLESYLEDEIHRFDCCPWCGQAIDWSEETEDG